MIRGAIEQVRPNLISGWMHSDDKALRGQLALAFLDNACIGSGPIGIHRADLEGAGLGDGHLGFSFPLRLPSIEDAGRVVVKLERSDVVLIQRTSRVVPSQPMGAAHLDREEADERVAGYKWMMSRGWIVQSEYDFLKCIAQLGVYESMLQIASGQKPDLAGAGDVASGLLSLFHQKPIDVVENSPQSIEAADALFATARGGHQRAVIGLWAQAPCMIGVAEGSHLRAANSPAKEEVLSVDPSRMVFLDAHVRVDMRDAAATGALHVFTAATRARSEVIAPSVVKRSRKDN